jgi:large subunit ribosomal protein L13
MKTYQARLSTLDRAWHVIDATNRPLGKLAVEAATLLKGKHKPIYTPHLDTGDFVVVVNAAKIHVGSRKLEDKEYVRYSGYPGGLRHETLASLLSRKPERVIELAVRGMLPKNALGRAMFRKLKVYAGETHPHEAQVRGVTTPALPKPPGRAQQPTTGES